MKVARWIAIALLTAVGCSGPVGPMAPADGPCVWHTVNHSGVEECHVGPAPTVADIVGRGGRIDTRSHIKL